MKTGKKTKPTRNDILVSVLLDVVFSKSGSLGRVVGHWYGLHDVKTDRKSLIEIMRSKRIHKCFAHNSEMINV